MKFNPGFQPMVISDYQARAPFSSFLPGIAGPWGIPVWVFYVNRGQGVCSFGFEDKDHALMEFWPANQAYQEVQHLGFRTFLRRRTGRRFQTHEPFQYPGEKKPDLRQTLRIEPDRFTVVEKNFAWGLETQVEYFSLVNESFGGLVRRMSLKNTLKKTVAFDVLDGAPFLVPCGINDDNLKKRRYLMEAIIMTEWAGSKVPAFRIRLEQKDTPDVHEVRESHFCICRACGEGGDVLVRPWVDPAPIFGPIANFAFPEAFCSGDFPEPTRKSESYENHFPCAFQFQSTVLKPGQSLQLNYIFGRAAGKNQLERLVHRVGKKAYLDAKSDESRRVVSEICHHHLTVSGSEAFDQYGMQNFLDNVVRGGLPVNVGKSVFYMFHRKHGDLERDYNFFRLSPSYFSQGTANYRDINQNRRNDLFFNPGVGEQNIVRFMNLLQLDGFNPLVIQESFYRLSPAEAERISRQYSLPADQAFRWQEAFLPGQRLLELEEAGALEPTQREALMQDILAVAQVEERAEHSDGFWTDHWTYNLDLLENYLAVYPEGLDALLNRKAFTFYDNAYVVMPRSRKYFLENGQFIQLHAVRWDEEKSRMIQARAEESQAVRTQWGRGEIYRTTLLVKEVGLFLVKLASLDPQGIGIEMEADKPNWYDALNGLPGLLGSSVCESFELARLIEFLLGIVHREQTAGHEALLLPEEMKILFDHLHKLLAGADLPGAGEDPDFQYWDRANRSKEEFREAVRLGLSGREAALNYGELQTCLRRGLEKIAQGLARAFDEKQGVYRTYFYYQPRQWTDPDPLTGSGPMPLAFERRDLPLFLEGNVHALRTMKIPDQALRLHRSLKKTALYDRELKMYKVCAPLHAMPYSIGRARGFAPGWLENESIWLHMEYKYLLELLRNGLYKEYYREMRQCLVPFLPGERYGRSIYENSSFIVSSAHHDKRRHGKGYYARLSGSTAEFIHMWLLMSVGPRPFYLNEQGELLLRFQPALAEWLFLKEPRVLERESQNTPKLLLPRNSYAFMFLGHTLVVYHNPGRKNTFGKKRAKIEKIILIPKAGESVVIQGEIIPAPWAGEVRNRAFEMIEVFWR